MFQFDCWPTFLAFNFKLKSEIKSARACSLKKNPKNPEIRIKSRKSEKNPKNPKKSKKSLKNFLKILKTQKNPRTLPQKNPNSQKSE
jgi:hypothetical protein